MALEIDGAAVLRAIATQPDVFPDLQRDLARTARALVVKQIKAKGTTVAVLRAVRMSVGEGAFALIVDGLSDADVRALLARFDAGQAEHVTAAPEWCRRHLIALANATREPVERAPPTRRVPAQESGVGALRHESVQAKPRRRSTR